MRAYWQSLLHDVDKNQQHFNMNLSQNLSEIVELLDHKFQLTQKLLNKAQQQTIESNVIQSQLKGRIQENEYLRKEIEMWNQIKRKCIQYEQSDISIKERENSILANALEEIEKESNEIRTSINEKKLRRDKIGHFDQSFISEKKDYNNKHPKAAKSLPIYKTEKKEKSMNVEFNPQNREIIYRIETFDRKLIELVVLFDKNEGKYCLKNPHRSLRSMDINAVKNFNIHQSHQKLYEQFQTIVATYIDNDTQ